MSESAAPPSAAVPADLDTPDRILYGLTVRQVLLLAAAAAVLWLVFQALTPAVPAPLVVAGCAPMAAMALAVVLGRRDGIALDRWLLAAARAVAAPRRLVAAAGGVLPAPAWALPAAPRRGRDPLPLRLPVSAVDTGGGVLVDGGRVALAAAGTVNLDLRTPDEQRALLAAMGGWLNALSAPVQIVVSTRRADLHALAEGVEQRLGTLPDPALADAAAGYGRFLRELAEDRDPLHRHLLVAHRCAAGADPAVARRQAQQSARLLGGLGAATRVLDGAQVTDALAAACQPWRHVDSGRAVPGAVVTGPELS